MNSNSSSSSNNTSNNLSNHLLNSQAFKIQNSLTKNFIDFNNLNQNEKMFQLATNGNSTTSINNNNNINTPLINNNQNSNNKIRTSSGRNNNDNNNNKQINDSNKFLDDILAHSKRYNNKQSTNLSTISTSNSIQLPSNVTVINRTSEERALYPDKLILERRNLVVCPIIEGDYELKLINYQHNHIKSIQNLDQMSNLIFLDLYDNCIERITGISSLVNLRVLMLGKNRIQKIENLSTLVYLDILDLHGNQV